MIPTRLLPIILLSFLGIACSKSEASTDARPENRSPQSASDGASYENATYKVRFEAPATYKKGEQGTARIVLETKGDYHINTQYPYKFVTQQPTTEGLNYPKSTVTRDDGVFEQHKAVINVPFVATQAGTAKIKGLFSLSVCTDANCLLDKRSLELSLPVE